MTHISKFTKGRHVVLINNAGMSADIGALAITASDEYFYNGTPVIDVEWVRGHNGQLNGGYGAYQFVLLPEENNMRQSIKYDAEFFRKMNSAKELQEDVDLKKQYSELLERMMEYVKKSGTIVNSYSTDFLPEKIIVLLKSDGFSVEEYSVRNDSGHTISW